MTLDEAIKHARHVAEAVCAGCAEDHLQLAEWLEDYKRLKLLEEENQQEPEMKPCPCCGGKAGMEEMAWDWVVECEKCQLSTRAYPTPEEAAKAWNRRL